MCDLRGLSKYEINQQNFEFIRNIPKKENEKYGWDKTIRGIYQCKKCGKLHYFIKANFKKYLKVCDNECNGIRYGNSTIVVYGYNDLATIHPELVKYFVNSEDAKKYTYGSNQKVLLKCPECGRIKEQTLKPLLHYGFSCDECSDGISYPEKFVSNLFNQLNIEYQKQFMFKDFNYRYDFYLTKYNTIIEIHGGQHYKKTTWKTYKEEHENDLFKYDLAVLNGYEYNKNFFIIDAGQSNIEYLKNSIEQCNFFKQFNLQNINWKQIDIKAQSSLKMKVCKYWNEHEDLTTITLGKIFEINSATVRDYLKWGNKNGLCVYDEKEEKRKEDERHSIFVYLIKENGDKWLDKPLNIRNLSVRTGISEGALKNSLHKKRPLTYNHCAKYDPKYIGSMVILAESTK